MLEGKAVPAARAVILGVVQGLTEFLPVSSSAHLVLLARLGRWRKDSLDLEVALHLGCLLALLAAFRGEWSWLLRSGLTGTDPNARALLASLLLACIPASVAGVVLERYARGTFRRLPQIAALTALMGGVLILADHVPGSDRGLLQVTWRDGLVIGLAQALALLPGVSRSGVTITAGVLLGFSLPAAVSFSFLLAAPILAGAGLWGLRHLPRRGIPREERQALAIGLITAALVGYVAITFMLRVIAHIHLTPFGLYRLLFALLLWRIASTRQAD